MRFARIVSMAGTSSRQVAQWENRSSTFTTCIQSPALSLIGSFKIKNASAEFRRRIENIFRSTFP